jgi:cell division transport system permease protein
MEPDIAILLKEAAPRPQQPAAPEAAQRRARRIRAVRGAVSGVAVLAVVAVGVTVMPALLTERVEVFLSPRPAAVTVSVFLTDDINPADQTAIEEELIAHPAVVSHSYQSKAEAYAHFLEQFADDPALLDGVGPEVLPASYQVTVTDIEAAGDLIDRLAGMPGMDGAAIVDD